MSQKIFLTSALAMGFVLPAMAETFPSNGYMQENKTYDNAATSTNMDGVYSGTVNAVAEYTDILYNIAAGNYLAAGSDATNGTECPAGSWCPGLTNALYNENTNQGINTCPSGYALSASGSSSQNDCYRTCTNADVAHSASVTGGYYYGNNNQCEPTACVNGWHIKSYVNLSETIGTKTGVDSAYVRVLENSEGYINSSFYGSGTKGQDYYGISETRSWAVGFDDSGVVKGMARCSTQPGDNQNWTWTNPTIKETLTDETGQDGANYCYCNLTGYKDTNGSETSLLSSWVFLGESGCSDYGNYCTELCVRYFRGDYGNGAYLPKLRAAFFGSTTSTTLASCEANTITINWSDASAADISANNAGTATYGSDVRTPVKAATKKGQTFRGWRFSAPEQTNLSN